VQSWYLDVTLLGRYFGKERVYHHTAPISSVFALAEGLRLLELEGMEQRAARHHEAAVALLEGLAPLGFRPLVAESCRLPMLSALHVPPGLDEAALRRRLLDRYGVEVGVGLGRLAGRIWRVGLMGENARLLNVEALLGVLRRELA
jgi:alanine-glyoxylate transaminase/serine-glyoxylate transaminase/serine-pyruvate transaminase